MNDRDKNSTCEIKDKQLRETLISIRDRDIKMFCFCVKRGVADKGEYYSLYLRFYSLLLAANGEIDQARNVLFFAKSEYLLRDSNDIDVLTGSYVSISR